MINLLGVILTFDAEHVLFFSCSVTLRSISLDLVLQTLYLSMKLNLVGEKIRWQRKHIPWRISHAIWLEILRNFSRIIRIRSSTIGICSSRKSSRFLKTGWSAAAAHCDNWSSQSLNWHMLDSENIFHLKRVSLLLLKNGLWALIWVNYLIKKNLQTISTFVSEFGYSTDSHQISQFILIANQILKVG